MYIYIYYFWCNIYNSILNSPKSTIVKTLFFLTGIKTPKVLYLFPHHFAFTWGGRGRGETRQRDEEKETRFYDENK